VESPTQPSSPQHAEDRPQPQSRHRSLSRIFAILVVIALVVAAFFIGRSFVPRPPSPAATEMATAETRRTLYQCSMHPQIVSDKPGKCPICGMNLKLVEEAPAAPTTGAPKEHKIVVYRNPMRADVTSLTPMKDEMGMDYIPVYADELAATQTEVPGHAGFTLSTEREQLIGVTRGKVELRDLNTDIRTVGQVAYDPDLYQTIIEYREALHREGAEAVTGAAALRLRQMGLSDEMIKELADPGHDPKSLLLPGKEVWVYAQLYEYEVDLVQPGQPVSVTAPSLPGRIYTAKVAAVDPILNSTTRTARARILVGTPDESLRPGMFVHVKLEIPLGKKLAVPFDAVLDTGENQIVFAVKGAGTFEPRSVKLGRQADGYYEVLSGLEEGEEVVTSANFLIDSESRFRSALAAFGKKSAAVDAH
jgi:membrane fusion protein, copper/silver efflux system